VYCHLFTSEDNVNVQHFKVLYAQTIARGAVCFETLWRNTVSSIIRAWWSKGSIPAINKYILLEPVVPFSKIVEPLVLFDEAPLVITVILLSTAFLPG